MTIDVRAAISCSLGEVVQGSISDSTIQEAGLIKTAGNVQVLGISTPAIGSTVTFTYTADGITRTIPRRLYVLSSFADPFRKLTDIRLGCKLTYLEDLRESVDWDALDDPENAEFTAADQETITVPIHASSAMDYCLEKLGITATDNPLTNKFSLAEFDYSAGYVQVLNDLLVSECYCGFINGDGELQVFKLEDSEGSGDVPVVSVEKLIDVGGVNDGALPGEGVTVSYSTLKLKNPDPDAATDPYVTAPKRWELNRTVNGPVYYEIEGQTFTGTEVTETRTTYRRINGNDVPVSRITTRTGPSASVGGSIVSAYIKNGIPFNAIDTTLSREEEAIDYDDDGNQVSSVVTTYEQELKVFGALSLQYVNSATDYVAFAYNLIKSGKTVTSYDNSERFRQSVVSEYTFWPFSIPGQQAIAESRDSDLLSTSAAVLAFISRIKSQPLALSSTRVEISLFSETPSRPKDVLNGAYADGGDPNNGYRTESSSELELALGSATAQRRIEFSLPYAPDDIFVRSGTEGNYTYTAQASDAPQKAAAYGRVQNKLLLAARSGMSVQCAGGVLPPKPYAAFVVTADGVAGQYRTNGTTWTMSGEGLIVSTDGLMMGGVGKASGSTGATWFPTSPTITTLPTAPAVVDTSPSEVLGTVATVGTTPQTVLDAAFPDAVAGDGVQDTSTDEFWVYDGTTWENVGTNPGPTMTVTTTVPVWNEVVRAEGRIRLKAEVVSLGYPLEVLTEIPVLRTKLSAGVTRIKKVGVPAASVSVAAQTPMVGISAAVRPPAAAISVAASAPAVSTGATVTVPAASISVAAWAPVVVGGASVAVPLAGITVSGQAPVSVGQPALLLEVPAAEIAVAAAAPAVSLGAAVVVPAVDVAVAAAAPSQVGPDLDPNFSSVTLLLQMNGADNSTSFPDSSSSALAVTANGNAKISTAQSKFGGASGYFDGAGDYLSIAATTATNLPSDFTIEAWLRPAAFSSAMTFLGKWGSSQRCWLFTIDNANQVTFAFGNNGSISAVVARATPSTLIANTWYHVAACRSGSTTRIFIDGVQAGANITNTGNNTGTQTTAVGINTDGNASSFNGYIDSVRVTKGVARYTSNFTPPTAAFPNS